MQPPKLPIYTSTRRPRPSRGGTILEAVFVLPIFLLFVLVVVEMGRYFLLRTSLGQAAQKGLALAKVIPQLEDDSLNDQDEPRNAALIAQIENLARTSAQSVYSGQASISASLQLPERNPSLREALNKSPMELTINAELRPLLGLIPTIKITEKAIGFREPLFASSEPELVDCFGRKIAGDIYQWVDPRTCPCKDPYTQIDPQSGACRCYDMSFWISWQANPNGMASLAKDISGKCGCSHIEGAEITAVSGQSAVCQCPACPEGRTARIVDQACRCETCAEQGMVDDGKGGCKCAGSCPATARADSSDCSCQCLYWSTEIDHPEYIKRGLTDFIQYDSTSGKCVCAATDFNCPEGQRKFWVENYYGRSICDCRACPGQSVFNPATHNCDCNLNVAACEVDLQHLASISSCTCSVCAAGTERKNGACRCTEASRQACISAKSRITSETDCRCIPCHPPARPSADGLRCECTQESSDADCEAPLRLQKSDCTCRCPQEMNGEKCPAGRWRDSSTCGCLCYSGVEVQVDGPCNGCSLCPGSMCAPLECKGRDCTVTPDCQLLVPES